MKTMPEMISGRIERLVPPPRHVPIPTMCTMLTGIVGLFGAVFFSFGMIFVWVFGSQVHPIDNWRVKHSSKIAPAIIQSISTTGASVNEEKVYKYNFQYQPGDGIPLEAECYTVNRRWKEGDRTLARYVPGHEKLASLEGASLNVFPVWILLLISLFPIVGFTLFIIPFISGIKNIKLLKYGIITGASNLHTSTSNMSINDEPVLKYSFQFTDRLGMTYMGSSNSLATPYLGDEAAEPVLYLPSDPERSMLVDSIPLKVPLGVDDSGQWYHKGGAASVFKMLLVAFLMLIHLFIAYIVYL